MTINYHINHEDEFVSVRVEGAVDLVEVYELCRSILADEHLNPAWPHLIDMRGMTPDVQTKALKPFVDFLTGSYRPHIKAPLAVVCDDNVDAELTAAVFRLTCAMGDTELFDDYRLALKWLLKEARHEAAGQSSTGAG